MFEFIAANLSKIWGFSSNPLQQSEQFEFLFWG